MKELQKYRKVGAKPMYFSSSICTRSRAWAFVWLRLTCGKMPSAIRTGPGRRIPPVGQQQTSAESSPKSVTSYNFVLRTCLVSFRTHHFGKIMRESMGTPRY